MISCPPIALAVSLVTQFECVLLSLHSWALFLGGSTASSYVHRLDTAICLSVRCISQNFLLCAEREFSRSCSFVKFSSAKFVRSVLVFFLSWSIAREYSIFFLQKVILLPWSTFFPQKVIHLPWSVARLERTLIPWCTFFPAEGDSPALICCLNAHWACNR
jgi:hypothetical protein